MDWVIPVRERAHNEELRYALRSIAANAPHGRIWLVGYRPSWVAGTVGHIPTVQRGSKYQNTTQAVKAACEHPEVSDPFILSNDDIFTLRPLTRVPVLHRGPVRDVEAYYARRAKGNYVRGMRETRELLDRLGHPDPLSYELHVPLPVRKDGMLAALEAAAHLDVLHKRTAYAVLNQIGGRQVRDVKILHAGKIRAEGAFLSTLPLSWRGHAGRLVRSTFLDPSPYERRPGDGAPAAGARRPGVRARRP